MTVVSNIKSSGTFQYDNYCQINELVSLFATIIWLFDLFETYINFKAKRRLVRIVMKKVCNYKESQRNTLYKV